MKLRIKRSLFLVHRWFGVAMCMLFAMWFATGIIMMYVEYPELTEEERLATLAPLDLARVTFSVDEAIAASKLDGRIATIALSAIGARPAYRLRDDAGAVAVVLRRRRQPLRGPRAGLGGCCGAALGLRGGRRARDLRAARSTSINGRCRAVLDEHRPLHRVAIGDERGTVVYVSDTTGQIVRDTHRTERAWNWLGSTFHWIYPYQLRRHVEPLDESADLPVGRQHRLGRDRRRHRRAAAAAAPAVPRPRRLAVCRRGEMASRARSRRSRLPVARSPSAA